jgi:hypothetical protein
MISYDLPLLCSGTATRGRGRGRGGRSDNNTKRAPKTAADLDAEMEACERHFCLFSPADNTCCRTTRPTTRPLRRPRPPLPLLEGS